MEFRRSINSRNHSCSAITQGILLFLRLWWLKSNSPPLVVLTQRIKAFSSVYELKHGIFGAISVCLCSGLTSRLSIHQMFFQCSFTLCAKAELHREGVPFPSVDSRSRCLEHQPIIWTSAKQVQKVPIASLTHLSELRIHNLESTVVLSL